MKSKRTKALEISKQVKLRVWERDNHRCIFCGRYVDWNFANSHYIKRSQGGLGIEENIMTNCINCHKDFEETSRRKEMKIFARNYLIARYPNWNENNLIYKKWR